MAQYQNQYSAGQTDESDNLRRTDEYGNPTHNTGIGGTHNTGTTGMCTGDQQQMGQQGLGGKLNRSGSGSSSSDEEDGQGGRRKKGLKERIPGVGHRAQDVQCLGQGQGEGRRPTAATNTQGLGYGATNTHGVGGTPKPDGYDAATAQDEKKGMMEKIKEKLPGGHNK